MLILSKEKSSVRKKITPPYFIEKKKKRNITTQSMYNFLNIVIKLLILRFTHLRVSKSNKTLQKDTKVLPV